MEGRHEHDYASYFLGRYVCTTVCNLLVALEFLLPRDKKENRKTSGGSSAPTQINVKFCILLQIRLWHLVGWTLVRITITQIRNNSGKQVGTSKYGHVVNKILTACPPVKTIYPLLGRESDYLFFPLNTTSIIS